MIQTPLKPPTFALPPSPFPHLPSLSPAGTIRVTAAPSYASFRAMQSSMVSISTRVGPSTASAETPIPGVIGRLNYIYDKNLPTADPSLRSIIPKHALANFAHQTGVGAEIMAPVFRRKISYSDAIRTGIFDKVWEAFRKDEVVEDFIDNVYTPIADIHCPHISGCKAKYIQETTHKKQHFLNVQVFGFGGGKGSSISLGTGYEISTEEKCLRVYIPIKIRIQKKKPDKGKIYTKISIEEILGGFGVKAIEKKHSCGKDFSKIKTSNIIYEKYSLKERGTFKTSKWIDRGKKINYSIKLPPYIGIDIRFKTSVEVLNKIRYDYELVGQNEYIGYFPKSKSSMFCWTWKK